MLAHSASIMTPTRLTRPRYLIPIMNILPADHARVTGTIARLLQSLQINGFLHRFVDSDPDRSIPAMIGDEEGAFLICSFWLAQVFAQRGETDRSEAILVQAETIAGDLGLFAEAVDARIGTFLGNTPLVFSQVEYARAAIVLERVRRRQTPVILSAGVPGRPD
jgi:alpha,alpha-trehalase